MAEKSRPAEVAEQSQANEEGRLFEGVYEAGFHLIPTLSEEEALAAFEQLEQTLVKTGASIIAKEAPKRMTLAYRIERSVQGRREKYTESYFGWIKFEGERSMIPSFEQVLHDEYNVLRSLLIHTTRESASQEPAVFASSRLEGEVIAKPKAAEEVRGEVSEAELDKSIETLVGE